MASVMHYFAKPTGPSLQIITAKVSSELMLLLVSGLIDFLISNHPIAKILRDHLVFKIVPMLNPDGVYLGNYR